MNNPATGQLKLFSQLPMKDGTHSILQIPLIRRFIEDGMPELLQPTQYSSQILDKIEHYMLGQRHLRQPGLRKLLSGELYDMLYGLKILANSSNLNVAIKAMEENEAWFKNFISAELKALSSEEE
ncbi:MAG: hypothetical protein IPN20_02990 [Haliscomenobacter sp.]|nr:hypothetical protein [Haliscomenobacter sp.]